MCWLALTSSYVGRKRVIGWGSAARPARRMVGARDARYRSDGWGGDLCRWPGDDRLERRARSQVARAGAIKQVNNETGEPDACEIAEGSAQETRCSPIAPRAPESSTCLTPIHRGLGAQAWRTAGGRRVAVRMPRRCARPRTKKGYRRGTQAVPASRDSSGLKARRPNSMRDLRACTKLESRARPGASVRPLPRGFCDGATPCRRRQRRQVVSSPADCHFTGKPLLLGRMKASRGARGDGRRSAWQNAPSASSFDPRRARPTWTASSPNGAASRPAPGYRLHD